jgi:hypothetical protein
MKVLLLFLRILLIIAFVVLIVSLGVKLLALSVRFWYLTLPVILLIYLMLSESLKKKKRNSPFPDETIDPHNEVKPDKDPEIFDAGDDEPSGSDKK